MPGLTWGGWHDAGDTDLPTGGNAETALHLALAAEEFAPARDVTPILREDRRVNLFRPDGKDDLLQQVAYGLEFLLGMYRAFGHAGVGMIDRTWEQYLATGDPAFTSDNLPYDPALGPREVKDGRSGKNDDRWAFTTRNTGGNYQLAQLCAVAARVLAGFDQPMADECLKAARDIWAYEQTHPPTQFDVAYQPKERDHAWELRATAELFVTTGDPRYRARLLALRPEIEHDAARTRSCARRAARSCARWGRRTTRRSRPRSRRKPTEARALLQKDLAWSPYGVTGGFQVWGNGWDVLDLGAELYWFVKHLPEVFDRELQVATVMYCSATIRAARTRTCPAWASARPRSRSASTAPSTATSRAASSRARRTCGRSTSSTATARGTGTSRST